MAGVRPNIREMRGYAPGEQPRDGEIIKLNTNENPYPPSPRVFEAIRSCLNGEQLRKYPDPIGTSFRVAASQVLDVDPDSILIGNGSDDILTILTRTFVPDRGVIASPMPSYVLYKTLAEIQNASFSTVQFQSDWTLPKSWPIENADITFLANPNSPSGTVVDHSSIEDLISQLNGPLVIDEAYVDFCATNCLHFTKQRDRTVIVSRTLSKSYALAGIRFGFAVARPEIIREMVKVKDSYNCDAIAIAAATAAMEDQEYLSQIRDRILATRARMVRELEAFGFMVTPSESNFVWCRHPIRSHREIYEALKNRRILIRYMRYDEYGDGIRISVGTEQEIDRLFEELRGLV